MLEVQNLIKTFDGERQKRRSRGQTSPNGEAAQESSPSTTSASPSSRASCSPCWARRDAASRRRCGPSRAWSKPDCGRRLGGRQRVVRGGRRRAEAGERARQQARTRHGLPVLRDLAAHDACSRTSPSRCGCDRARQRPGKREITERVERVLETMELLQYADRHATKLSGGQQQRLALARAIVIEPSLLLLDEPLSNLDAKLRESLRFELKRLQRELGITSIYVTHDQIEALSLSSNIAVMRAGEVVQLGKPRTIYENPQSKFVAEFIGTSNFIDGTVASRDGDRHVVETRDGRLTLDSGAHVHARHRGRGLDPARGGHADHRTPGQARRTCGRATSPPAHSSVTRSTTWWPSASMRSGPAACRTSRTRQERRCIWRCSPASCRSFRSTDRGHARCGSTDETAISTSTGRVSSSRRSARAERSRRTSITSTS